MKREYLAGLGALMLAVVAQAADESYDILIQRPFKVGQAYAMTATNTSRSVENLQLPDGQLSRSAAFQRVNLEADIHVDQVDEMGSPTMCSLVIRKLTLQVSEGNQSGLQVRPKEVLPANTELVALLPASGPAQFDTKKAKAGVLPDEAMLALQQGFRRLSTTDAVYGSKNKRKVGDTWKLDTQAMSGDKMSPNYVDPAKVSGNVTLKTVHNVSGVSCLQIEATMDTKDFQVQGVAPKEATMNTQFGVNLPVDVTQPIASWNVRSTTHLVIEEKSLTNAIKLKTVDSEITYDAAMTPK